jgi:hypothetical protein
MTTATKPVDTVDLALEELRATIDRYLNGVRDLEGRTKIAEQMDRVRESLPHDNTAVGLIREHRGDLPEPSTASDLESRSKTDDPGIKELGAAIDDYLHGIRDPEVIRQAAERMDRMRKSMPKTNIAVELVREARGER